MGMLSPVTVRAKLLMHKLWTPKFEWDQALLEEINAEWSDIVQDLHKAVSTELPRSDATFPITPNERKRLYTTCIYRCQWEGLWSLSLHCWTESSYASNVKKQGCPNQENYTAKLELKGTLVGARLANHIIKNLGKMKVQFWSDSQIALRWITSTKPQKKFILNRVAEIRNLVEYQNWRYCPTEMNPADLITRGTDATKITEGSFWINGPDGLHDQNGNGLRRKEIHWPLHHSQIKPRNRYQLPYRFQSLTPDLTKLWI